MPRVAAIDIGTNSVLLTIAEPFQQADAAAEAQNSSASKGLSAVVERATVTRLGQGVDRERRLAPEAIQRTLNCLTEYAKLIAEYEVSKLRVVGTSAMRDAAGSERFIDEATRILGVNPEVISGQEEAELTYRGALSGLPAPAAHTLVFDIGGGSTEFIYPSGNELSKISLNIGSVRLTERHIAADPPSHEALGAMRDAIRESFAQLPKPSGPLALVGVAGTVTTLYAVAHAIEPYHSERVHGSTLNGAEVERLFERLVSLPLAERVKLPGLEPGRADVIIAGAQLVLEVLRWSGANEFIVSSRGVRWGVLERLLEAQ